MRYLAALLLLMMVQSAHSQTVAGCEQLMLTPVGDQADAKEIVRNCENFIHCGIDSQDVYNCVKVQVMGMLIFEAREENPKFTYGDLFEKLKEYISKPGYVAFKERQKKLLGIITDLVSNDNWANARPILLENGFKPDDVSRMKALFDKNAFESWTYAQLIQEYANTGQEY